MNDRLKVRVFLGLMLGPALLVIGVVVAYPLLYNVLLSLSNANIYHIRDWKLIGFQQYQAVFAEPLFWNIFGKTVLWTVINVVFHVLLGVFLAVILNQK